MNLELSNKGRTIVLEVGDWVTSSYQDRVRLKDTLEKGAAVTSFVTEDVSFKLLCCEMFLTGLSVCLV